MTNETQKQYYLDSLPNLCRAQQEVFKSVTTSWRVTLKEIAKYNRSDNEVYQKVRKHLKKILHYLYYKFDISKKIEFLKSIVGKYHFFKKYSGNIESIA